MLSHKLLLSFLLICTVAVSPPPAKAAEITCETVHNSIKPCLNYVMSGGNVTEECCTSFKSCIARATTTSDRQTICSCIKDIASASTDEQVDRIARNSIDMEMKNFCFCMMNWKSNKTKQERYKSTPKERVPQYSKPRQKIRGFNTMAAADGHTDHVNHGVANNPGSNDTGAAGAAIIATAHMHDMDGDGGGE
ncbi:hypothetical protein HAX54_004256 [Datura stramonium]|uniref:Uncharacterized protein n=1 Tax=Datura stramonium TaxID=4076 RepID=A0ABS8T7E9_DATST|nr:hypothetical protein [Datura stramonium]